MVSPNESLECLKLLFGAVDLGDGPERALGDRRPAGGLGHGQDVLLDLGSQAEESHDLGHAGTGDSLPAGDVGVVCGLAGLEGGRRPPGPYPHGSNSRGLEKP